MTTSDPSQAHQFAASITIRASYREVGTGLDEIEISWEEGTNMPSTTGICDVIRALAFAKGGSA